MSCVVIMENLTLSCVTALIDDDVIVIRAAKTILHCTPNNLKLIPKST
jgi:hypothetical protein